MSTSQRTIRLLSLLQTRRFYSGEQLAQKLGVSLRTVRRDMQRLRDLGYPVLSGQGVGGGYQLATGAALPPLILDDEEALSLVVGLQSTAQNGEHALAEAAVRAMGKIIPELPAALSQRAGHVASSTVWPGRGPGASSLPNPIVLVDFAQACHENQRLAFTYTDAKGAETERRVEPATLVRLDSRYYLVGYDLERQDWRNFRLDRASKTRLLGTRFTPRAVPGGDAAQYVRESMRGAGSFDVSALVHAPLTDVRQKIGRWLDAEEVDAHTTRVSGRESDLPWIVFALSLTEAEISEVHPPQLRELFAAWAERWQRAAN